MFGNEADLAVVIVSADDGFVVDTGNLHLHIATDRSGLTGRVALNSGDTDAVVLVRGPVNADANVTVRRARPRTLPGQGSEATVLPFGLLSRGDQDMTTGIRYEHDYIIGGPARGRVTPDFPDCRSTRGLTAACACIANSWLPCNWCATIWRRASPLPACCRAAAQERGLDGRFAWLKSASLPALAASAARVARDGWLLRIESHGNVLYVEMPDPDKLPALAAERALDLAIAVTAAFETSGDPHLQVTGNFDGAGLSFGPLQVNLGTGTLQELFRRHAGRDEARLRACFGALWPEWQRMLRLLPACSR